MNAKTNSGTLKTEWMLQPGSIDVVPGELMEIELTIVMQASNVLGYDDNGDLCQLWCCPYTGQKEWRKIGHISEMEP